MPYTLGGATNDRLQFGLPSRPMGNGTISFIAGWFLPTTLTAGRVLFGSGATCIQIDTTTSELRFVANFATTAGEWTSSGVGLTVNEWKFVAVLIATGTTAGAIRMWVGTVDTPPVEVTMTSVVSPSGTMQSANTMIAGNNSGNVSAFQGDIAEILGVATNATAQSPLWVASASAITNAEADLVARRFVQPAWLGTPSSEMNVSIPAATRFMAWQIMMNTLPVAHVVQEVDATTQPAIVPTITGATVSQNGHPRGRCDVALHARRRRRG